MSTPSRRRAYGVSERILFVANQVEAFNRNREEHREVDSLRKLRINTRKKIKTKTINNKLKKEKSLIFKLDMFLNK